MKMNRTMMTFVPIVLSFIFLITLSAARPGLAGAEDTVEEQGLVDKARVTFEGFMADAGMTWLHDHLKDAKGVLIVPQMLKGGFILGASGGSGVLFARDEKSSDWNGPAFYNIGAVSFGLQIGASAAEVVMLVMTQKAVDALLATRFKLGGEVSAAIGPVGAGASAKGVTADIISFSRAKGAFIGLSLEGAIVDTADGMNKAYYGKTVRPADILITREVVNPKSAELRGALNKASKQQ